MVYQGMPIANWTQLIEDQHAALEATPRASSEQLPAYTEAMKGRPSVDVTEKKDSRQPSQQKKSSSKMSTLKSIFVGEAHKHHLRYLDHVASQTATEPRAYDQKCKSKSSSQSTLKSILTGDVQKYHPMYRLEESIDSSVRR